MIYGAAVRMMSDGTGDIFVQRFEKPLFLLAAGYRRIRADCRMVKRAKEMVEESPLGWEGGIPAGRIVVKEK